jgi:hypothetical protein
MTKRQNGARERVTVPCSQHARRDPPTQAELVPPSNAFETYRRAGRV